jgi:hypothetical protein
MLERLYEVRATLVKMVNHKKWRFSRQLAAVAEDVAAVVESSAFWDKVQQICTLLRPIAQVLRIADQDQPCMGEVFAAQLQLECRLQQLTPTALLSSDDIMELQDLHRARWSWAESPLHSVGFLLSPKQYQLARELRIMASSNNPAITSSLLPGLTQQRAATLNSTLQQHFRIVATVMLDKDTAQKARF